MTTGNSMMQLEQGVGWSRGLRNLLRVEFADWFDSSRWWTQILIWTAVIDGLVLVAALTTPEAEKAEASLMAINLFFALIVPIAVIVMMMGAVVEEKQTGTAAWVLSKPASRQSFILAKLIANTVGVVVTMVAVQALLAYLIMTFVGGAALSPLGFLAGLGVHIVNLFFYVALTTMLGTLFDRRGPVIGIPIAFAFMHQYLAGLGPFVANFLPWTLVAPPLITETTSIAPALMTGTRPESLVPIVAVLGESIVFIVVALWAFSREEL